MRKSKFRQKHDIYRGLVTPTSSTHVASTHGIFNHFALLDHSLTQMIL